MRNIFKVFLLASVFLSQSIYADFTNGGFEDPSYITTTNPNVGIPSWTSTGYLFTGYRAGLVLPPKSLDDIVLVSSPKAPYNAPLKSDQKKIFFSYKTIIFIMIFATRNLKNETVCKKI